MLLKVYEQWKNSKAEHWWDVPPSFAGSSFVRDSGAKPPFPKLFTPHLIRGRSLLPVNLKYDFCTQTLKFCTKLMPVAEQHLGYNLEELHLSQPTILSCCGSAGCKVILLQRIIPTLQILTQILPISNPTGNLQGVNEGFWTKQVRLPVNHPASVSGGCRVGFIDQIWCESCSSPGAETLHP